MSGRGFFLFLLLLASTAGFYYFFTQRPPEKPPVVEQPKPAGIKPYGGEYLFTRLELPVPQFLQADPKWRDQQLAKSEDTLGSAGCAVASTAMVLGYYGVDTDPSRLDKFLTKAGGYTPEAWLIWEKAAELAPEVVAFKYEGDPVYKKIDDNLKRRNPVIVRLRYPEGRPTHFVVICGKEGHDYLIRDPGRGSIKGVYKLRDFGSDIEALRYYEKVAPAYEPPALAAAETITAPKIEEPNVPEPEPKVEPKVEPKIEPKPKPSPPATPPKPELPKEEPTLKAKPVEEVESEEEVKRARPVEE